MYRLVTIHFVTDRRTDDCIMPLVDHNAWQCDLLMTYKTFITSMSRVRVDRQETTSSS